MGLIPPDDGQAGLVVRRMAIEVLHDVLHAKRMSDEALVAAERRTSLERRDRAMLRSIVLGTLRHLGEIDSDLGNFLSKPLPRKSGAVQMILRSALCQLAFLGMPAHAVIDASVSLARADHDARHFAGLVNAVLRNAVRQGLQRRPAAEGGRLNTPVWAWSRWASAFGVEHATRIVAAHAFEPSIDITVRDVSDVAALGSALGGTVLPTGSIRLTEVKGPIEEIPGFAAGRWWVQDVAAALPAKLLGDVRGKSVLDLCAAPGGKTLQLCAAGATVTAMDKSEARLGRLRQNLERVGFSAEVVVGEAREPLPGRLFDAVLLDAACSASGTVRRHPELLYIKDASQITQMSVIQKAMLRAAARQVKPGGCLVYCVCSLEQEEGETQVHEFLRDSEGFRLSPVRPGEAGIPGHLLSAEGYLRTTPDMELGEGRGMDGFFAARMLREH